MTLMLTKSNSLYGMFCISVFSYGRTIADQCWSIFFIFNRKETGIKIVLDNCLPEFDELAEKFVNALPEKQKEMIQLASDQMTTLNPNDRKYAEIYFKIMQKMLEKRIDFPEQESGRLSKILQGKLSSTKKKDLESRLNILQSFIKKPFDDAKEEL